MNINFNPRLSPTYAGELVLSALTRIQQAVVDAARYAFNCLSNLYYSFVGHPAKPEVQIPAMDAKNPPLRDNKNTVSHVVRYALSSEVKQMAPTEQMNFFTTHINNYSKQASGEFEEGKQGYSSLVRRITKKDVFLTKEDIFKFDRPWARMVHTLNTISTHYKICLQIARGNQNIDFTQQLHKANKAYTKAQNQYDCYGEAVNWAWTQFDEIHRKLL